MAPKRARRSDQSKAVRRTPAVPAHALRNRNGDGMASHTSRSRRYMLSRTSTVPGNPRRRRQYIESGVLVGSHSRHRLVIGTCAGICQWRLGERRTRKAPVDGATRPHECTPMATPVAAAEAPVRLQTVPDRQGRRQQSSSQPRLRTRAWIPSDSWSPQSGASSKSMDQILRHWTNNILDGLHLHLVRVFGGGGGVDRVSNRQRGARGARDVARVEGRLGPPAARAKSP